MSELAWEPTPEYVERANVTRLMRRHGIESIAELRRRSVEDVDRDRRSDMSSAENPQALDSIRAALG